MPGFSDTAIAVLRAHNRATLRSLAKIERPTRAASPGGGANTGKLTWTDVDDAIPCRLATMADVPVIIQAGQLTTPERLIVVFDLEGPAVQPGDRVTVTGTDLAGGAWSRAVLVLSPRNPRTHSAMRVFVCQDVPPGSA